MWFLFRNALEKLIQYIDDLDSGRWIIACGNTSDDCKIMFSFSRQIIMIGNRRMSFATHQHGTLHRIHRSGRQTVNRSMFHSRFSRPLSRIVYLLVRHDICCIRNRPHANASLCMKDPVPTRKRFCLLVD